MKTMHTLMAAAAALCAIAVSLPGASAAGLRAAADATKQVKLRDDVLTVPLGWNFNAQDPVAGGNIFQYGRPLLALQPGNKTDILGNALPDNAITLNGQRYTETVSAGVVTDNTAWAKSQSSSVGIQASFLGIFSAGVDYTNMAASSFAQSTTQQYAQIAGSLELQRVTLPLFELQLADDVMAALTALPPLGDSASLAAYADFFNQWDAHVVTEYTIGGSAHMFSSFDSTVTKSADIDSNTVGAFIQATFANWGAGVAGNHSWTNAQAQVLKQANSQTQIRCRGGDASICSQFSLENPTSSYNQWVQSISQNAQAAMIVSSVAPLWSDHFAPTFLPRPTLAADLEKAYTMYLAACPGAAVDNGYICAGRGQCDLSATPSGGNGTCDCFPGYGGPMCACPSNVASTTCSGHGSCSSNDSPGTCICDAGWGGNDCSQVSFPCPHDDVFNTGECGINSNNGKCNTTSGNCVCSEGRTGPACNIPCGGNNMRTLIGADASTSWWVIASQGTSEGTAMIADTGEFLFEFPSTSSPINTDSKHNAFRVATEVGNPSDVADAVCQFLFNFVVGTGGGYQEMASIPIHQVQPFYPSKGWWSLTTNLWQPATYGYTVLPSTEKAGAPPTELDAESSMMYAGLGYECTANCVQN